tara:strand:- start:243 stop:422 length:180 start_codon:yes stop_codon:yes gene_type:complete
MATIEIKDETKKILKRRKKLYEKSRGKTTWKEFMDLIVLAELPQDYLLQPRSLKYLSDI